VEITRATIVLVTTKIPKNVRCTLLVNAQANYFTLLQLQLHVETLNIRPRQHLTYRVAQKKTEPAYLIANILKTPLQNCMEIGELLQYYNAEHSN